MCSAPSTLFSHARLGQRLFVVGLVVLAVFALYVGAVRLMPFHDDAVLMPAINNRTLLTIFENRPYGDGHHRPMSYLPWLLSRDLFGWFIAPVLHWWNVAAHVLNTALVASLAARLGARLGIRSRLLPVVSGLLFGFAPLSYEAVLWASALVHPWMAMFGLFALHAWLSRPASGDLRVGNRPRVWATLACAGLLVATCLSHEMGFVFGALVLMIELFYAWRGKRRPAGTALALLGLTASYALIYRFVLVTKWTNPASRDYARNPAEVVANLAYQAQNFSAWVYTLFGPFLRRGYAQPLALVSGVFALALGLAALALWRTRSLAFGALTVCLWLVLIGPSSLLLTQDYVWSSPRMSYLPSIAVAVFWGGVVASLVTWLTRRIRPRDTQPISAPKHPAHKWPFESGPSRGQGPSGRTAFEGVFRGWARGRPRSFTRRDKASGMVFRSVLTRQLSWLLLVPVAAVVGLNAQFISLRLGEALRLTPALKQIDGALRNSPPSAKLLLINSSFVNLAAQATYPIGKEGLPLWEYGYVQMDGPLWAWPAAVSNTVRDTWNVRHAASLTGRDPDEVGDYFFTNTEPFRYGIFGEQVDDGALRARILHSNLIFRFDYDAPGFRVLMLARIEPDADPTGPMLAQFGASEASAGVSVAHAQAVRCGDQVIVTITWQAAHHLTEAAAVFVHGYAGDQQVVVADRHPVGGYLPLDQFPSNTTIDERRVLVDAPGGARITGIHFGVYDRVTGKRMSAARAGNGMWDNDEIVIPVQNTAIQSSLCQ